MTFHKRTAAHCNRNSLPRMSDEEPVKVLVVDDDRTMRILFEQLLTRLLSCEVIEAGDGQEGLDVIEQEPPDLVLLDTLMPVMDGIAMLEALRSNPLHTNIPVVSVSSVTDTSMILKLISLGILDYVFKPVQWGDTKPRLETVIGSLGSADEKLKGAGFEAGSERENLLLIDKNPEFRGRARPVLERHFVVREASSCVEGLDWVREHHPDVVCIADGQALRDARMLAEAIRSMPSERPAVYLLTERLRIGEEELHRYDGVVARSYVPGLFMREVRRLRASASARAGLRERFESEVRAQLVSETQ
jgi:two-component system chemotaxis response regulator CheY